MEQCRYAYKVLVGKPEGKKTLREVETRSWEDNIKMDLKEVDCDPENRIDLVEDRDQLRAYVRAVMNLRVS